MVGNKKDLVFITARLPYPPNSGRKNVMYNYCKILHEVFDYRITLISFLEAGDTIDPKPDFIYDVIELPSISGKRKLFNLIKYTFLLREFPMQVSLFYNPKYKILIKEHLRNINPDILIADMVRTTEYAQDFEKYKIADLDDMLSIRYGRQLEMDMETINPYGAYLFTLASWIQTVLTRPLLKKFILKNEVKLLTKYEETISTKFDNTVFVAEREANILNNKMKFDKAISIPLGVDMEYFGEYYGSSQTKKHTIGFLGAMSVAHNESGVIHFIKNILPQIVEQVPDVKFIIVGGGVTDKVKAIADESIIFTGRVDDVRIPLVECEVFVCPLTFGSGIKTKNLESMAMGIPVVTTEVGAENINAIDGKEWLVAKNDEDFANKVVMVMKDLVLRQKLSTCGHEFVKNNYTWKIAEERIKKLLNEKSKVINSLDGD